jgi:uncharacterized phage protein (TIGR02220 family)
VNCLLRLWIYATQNKPDGVLDMTNEDIELQVDWRGDPNEFVTGLLESEYLILGENSYELYGWLENNPHLDPLAVQKRKLRASKGGQARAKKLASKQKECATKQSQAGIKQENCANKLINKVINKNYIVEFKEILDYMNGVLGTRYKHTTKKNQGLIKARLKEGFTVDDFKTVIDRKHKEWSTNPDMLQYLRPATLFGTNFESYLNQPRNSAG